MGPFSDHSRGLLGEKRRGLFPVKRRVVVRGSSPKTTKFSNDTFAQKN
jgi:hypothetical protein